MKTNNPPIRSTVVLSTNGATNDTHHLRSYRVTFSHVLKRQVIYEFDAASKEEVKRLVDAARPQEVQEGNILYQKVRMTSFDTVDSLKTAEFRRRYYLAAGRDFVLLTLVPFLLFLWFFFWLTGRIS